MVVTNKGLFERQKSSFGDSTQQAIEDEQLRQIQKNIVEPILNQQSLLQQQSSFGDQSVSTKKKKLRPPPIIVEKMRQREIEAKTVNVSNAIGPESPLTPNLLQGNYKFDKYMQSKIMVWHNNKQRDVTIQD